jgi:hypothetical protein
MELLDMKCAECGNKIAAIGGNTETLITKSLGVLQEDGVYAFYLFLVSRGSKEDPPALKTTQETFRFLKERGVFASDVLHSEEDLANEQRKEYTTELLNAIRLDIANNLDKLLFAKELLERTLVYARYHAKALEKTKSQVSPESASEEGGA